MKTFTLPGTTMTVPNVVLGLMRIPDMTDEAIRELVDTAREAGITFLDHADVYGGVTASAFGLLDDLEVLVASLDSTPVRPLRTGGLSTRDVAALARRLDTGAGRSDGGTTPHAPRQALEHATFVLECAYAARLVAPDPAGLAPTTAYDSWLAEPAPRRWRCGSHRGRPGR